MKLMTTSTESRLTKVREAAEADLETFIRLVAPHRVLGAVHSELCRWWTRSSAKDNQLVLIPRAHQKSAMIAYRVAWWLTKHPHETIMYVSATSNLAEKQLYAIKQILDSKIYRRYWPEMTNPDEGKREKWSATEIAVDHPKRTEEGIRDPSIWATGVNATQAGMHSGVVVYDDLVVPENAYTIDGRSKVAAKYSQMASVANPGSKKWVVGTRYHPKDIYADLQAIQVPVFDKKGRLVPGKQEALYEIFERQVESDGDGYGEFLWPRQQRKDGTWFGFDPEILGPIRAEYLDKSQFKAQYYNDPSDPDDAPILSEWFQYYDRQHLRGGGGRWTFKSTPLKVFAAVDFAFSRQKKADYTALVVVGVDSEHNYYVMDIERFKTDRIRDYFEAIRTAYDKWGFRNIRLEVTAAQQAVVTELKDIIKYEGLVLKVDEFRPTRHDGNKHERIQAILEPRYSNKQIWHYQGGNCQILEEELTVKNPAHDDVKDALAAAVDSAKAPAKSRRSRSRSNVVQIHGRFGGVAR